MRQTATLASCAAVLFAASYVGLAQVGPPVATQATPTGITFDRLVHADREPGNWLTYSGTLSGWRHSPLTEITFVRINWLSRFDDSGRPIRTAPVPDVPVKPGPGEMGATSWYPPSYSPRTGLFYVPAWETSVEPPYGALLAIDPRSGDRKWEFRRESSPGRRGGFTFGTFSSGALTTASGLIFTGARAGGPFTESVFHALDAATGQLLWQAALPGATHSGPMSYAVKGKQFVTITAGDRLLAFALRP